MAGKRVTANIRVEVTRSFWRTRNECARVGDILLVDIVTLRRLVTSGAVKRAPLVQTPTVQKQDPAIDMQSVVAEFQQVAVQTQEPARQTRAPVKRK